MESNFESVQFQSLVPDSEQNSIAPEHEEMKFLPTFVNILSTLTGAEVLSVSNSMTLMGYIPSVIMMVCTTILSYFGTIIVLKLREKVAAESINELATRIIAPWAGTVYSSLTLCFTYSCQVAYLIVGADSVTHWIGMAGYPQYESGVRRSIVVLIYALILPVLLSVPREMKILSLISSFAVFIQAFYVSGLIYEGIRYLPKQGIDPTVESYIKGGMLFFNAFAIYSQLFAFPSVVLPLVRYFSKDMQKRAQLIGASFVSCFSISFIPGVIGYLIFGSETHQISISSFPSNDVVIQIIRVGFFVVVNASYAVVSITVMQDISSLLYKVQNPADLPFFKRVSALFLANALPVGIAMILPNVRPAFEIGGAFGGCLSNFFIPPLLWVVKSSKKWYHPFNILMSLFSLFGLVSAGIATYQAVVDAIHGV
jgi:amino acid permease